MKNIIEFTVVPSLPAKLSALREIALNLCWSWNHEAIELFRRMDPQIWEETGHNPVELMGRMQQEQLDVLAQDDGFLDHLERVNQDLTEYMEDQKTWYGKNCKGKTDSLKVAYFSAEFGITECLPIYSGGLGILAGDHLKSASDLGIPFVGVGLMYRHGYFRQYLNIDGYQQEAQIDCDPFRTPVSMVRDSDDNPLVIDVDFPGRKVYARIWKAQVGRVPLYLLDTNIPQNTASDRQITYQLYGGDKELRIQQEIMIGIGGIRALDILGIEPTVCHMNEGHAAFLGIERIRKIMDRNKLAFNEARFAVRAGGVFTTHTPVPAGIDMFDPGLVDRYFSVYYKDLQLDRKGFLALGRRNPENDLEPFNMVYLAFRLSSCINGVSKLHADVSRKMWQQGWPGVPVDDIPITHITNGIHIQSWISREAMDLYNRYLGRRWSDNPADKDAWKLVERMPMEELWRTHERRRERLVSFARRRLSQQLKSRGASLQEIADADEVLQPGILTIGFARRFATYKRANLILRDKARLKKILTNPDRPVQIIFAGKAHPRDEEGKALIRDIVHFSQDPDIRRHVVFLENQDMIVSRYMVQGVDVWLNNPRRPMEASGTSGMKVVANGGMNLSILDGWWCEAVDIDSNTGWSIGKGEDYENHELQDEIEANLLYNLLENEVAPLFYERGEDSLPRPWIQKMKASIGKLAPEFNTHRMVEEYTERFYISANLHSEHMSGDEYSRARQMAVWREKVKSQWKNIKIGDVNAETAVEHLVGTSVKVTAHVFLGELAPEDVAVEVYSGTLNQKREIVDATTIRMDHISANGDGWHEFEGTIDCTHSGQHGLTLRVLPYHEDMVHPYELRLILWQ